MRCERVEELLSDYLEGAVGDAMLIPLEAHLRECAQCRALADGLRDVWRLLDSAPVVEPPVDFRATVWRKIDAAEQSRQRSRPAFDFSAAWRRLWTRPALAWGAAVLLVVVLSGVAVPGRYHLAGLGMIWHGSGVPQVKAAVTVGAPTVTGSGAAVALSVPVTNNGDTAATVTLHVLDANGERKETTVQAPAHSSQLYDVMSLQPGEDASHFRIESSTNP